jgi:glycosyltransferase involved in cell wall biosynthesis
MHLSLIVPAPFDTISGGYGYDRRIVSGLRALGHDIDVVELAGTFPQPNEAAFHAAHASWAHLPENTIPLIDGLALPAFDGLEDTMAARDTAGLIHHPLSLETGLSETARTTLADVEQRLFPHLRRIIVTSGTTADTVASYFHVPAERIRIVVPGTDDAPRCPGSAGSTREVLAIGTLVPRKGHDTLLRAMATLPDLNWHLTIVGSPDRDATHALGLAALADELAIAHRVRFAGELVGEALETVWHAADIFALATHYEGYGMAIAEALKRGLPVVVTQGGAAGALITPGSGYVCQVGDLDQLANSLRCLIAGDTARRAMAEEAWQVGQTLPSWKAQAALFARYLG